MEKFAGKVKEMLFPEFREIKEGMNNLNIRMDSIEKQILLMSKRLDDHQAQLVMLNQRIDAVREELTHRIDETNKRIDNFSEEVNRRIFEVHERLDALYNVVVRREEHYELRNELAKIAQRVDQLEARLASR